MIKKVQKNLFKNYANIYSNVPLPTSVNEGQKFPLTSTDTLDWEILGTKLICKNAGLWDFRTSSGLSNLGIDSSTTSGAPPLNTLVNFSVFFNINGNILQNCVTTASISNTPDNIEILYLNTRQFFKKDDYIEFLCGTYSSSYPVVSTQCKARIDSSGVWDPAITISAIKIKE